MPRTFFTIFFLYICTLGNSSDQGKFIYLNRNLLSEPTQAIAVNYTHNETNEGKNYTSPFGKETESPASKAGTEAAVLIIVAIVVLSVIGMVVYFMRKFDQLNRSVPTYRYSSLKTEINGVYGSDDKTESQALVSVSTEEEEDYDDDDDDDRDGVSPPTLMVRSQQTVMSSSKITNGTIAVPISNSLTSSEIISKSDTILDSDDELLQ